MSVPAETLARQRWRAVARILERRDRIREQLTEARARSGELHRALPAAEQRDREARGRALAEGKAMPPLVEAPPIAAELEEARQRIHDLEAAVAVVEQDLRQLRQQKGGAWSEHQAHQIEQARRAVLAATAGLDAAVSTLEDEHGLQRWASENADRGSFDPTGGRITHSGALAAALDQVRAAVDGLAAGQQRPEPESRPEPSELQKFLARTRASAWGR